MKKKSNRLDSIDALRGFDMFFIMGGGAFFIALAQVLPYPIFENIAQQMNHVQWHGFHFEDLIFPLFLFIAGISFPFSLEKQIAQKRSPFSIHIKIIRRGLLLVLLGIIYNGFLSHLDFTTARYGSVLGRIGLAWMFAALIFLHTKVRTRIILSVVILVGYFLLLRFWVAPDFPEAGSYSMKGSFVGYIDRLIMPGKLYLGRHDPEGLFSTIPAIVTGLLGMFAGEWIRYKKNEISDWRKVTYLALVGGALIILALVWNPFFPINKNLWTSSFVCLVGGISSLLFAIFYLVIDILKWKRGSLFFKVIGLNSITIYLAQHFIDFKDVADKLFGGIIKFLPESYHGLGDSIAYIILCWGFLYFLYKKKIFLKV